MNLFDLKINLVPIVNVQIEKLSNSMVKDTYLSYLEFKKNYLKNYCF